MSNLDTITNLHSKITNDVWPNGWTMKCKTCGKTVYLTKDECVYCLGHGWPKCCGYDMVGDKAVKDTPLLMKPEMIVAYQKGIKGQTRRTRGLELINKHPNDWNFYETQGEIFVFQYHGYTDSVAKIKSPYGLAGDKLWFREACQAYELSDGLDGVIYQADYLREEQFVQIENTREAAEKWLILYHYRGKEGAIVPSIHMPRWASRYDPTIISIRPERLQDISLADINAEGTPDTLDPEKRPYGTRREQFQRLWDSINSKRGYPWDLNPWVWRIEFTKCGGL